jgi:TRAP transporter TAXI family solute receptor
MSDLPPPSRSFRARLVAVVLVTLVVVAAVLNARPPRDLTIETGPAGGSYYLDAVSYQKILKTRGIKLRLHERPNSLEIVQDVGTPHSGIDVGFVAQDASSSTDSPLFSLGQIELQPLFVFASADMGRRTVLNDLRGRKVVLPPANSATSAAALQVFQLYDITPDNTSFSFMPLTDAAKQLQAGRFDAGVFMLAPENPAIRTLAADSGLHLVPITETRAVANHLPFLRAVVLPRGIYDIADAIPPNNTPMVAATVGVVVRAGLHPYLIYALLDAMEKVHHGATFLSSAGDFPTPDGSQLTVHPLAVQYYRTGLPWAYRELPPWLACTVDNDQVLIFGLLAVAGLYILAMWLADTWTALWLSFLRRRAHRKQAGPGLAPAAAGDATSGTSAPPVAPNPVAYNPAGPNLARSNPADPN